MPRTSPRRTLDRSNRGLEDRLRDDVERREGLREEPDWLLFLRVLLLLLRLEEEPRRMTLRFAIAQMFSIQLPLYHTHCETSNRTQREQ